MTLTDMEVLKTKKFWKLVGWWAEFLIPIIVAIPFLCDAIVLDESKPMASRCLGITIITAAWWILEPIPIVITAFFPIFLFPLFCVSSASSIANCMFSDTSLIFLGGFVFSTAMVRWNLHSRIALKTVITFGLKPRLLLLGIMSVTAFLSMWISNTATTLTMIPNALAIISKLEELTGDPKLVEPFGKALFLGIAFSASTGGMMTLIGTPPNLIMVQVAKSVFPMSEEIGFAQFLFVALPTAFLILVITYLFFIFVYMRNIKLPENLDETSFRQNYEKLGKMRPPEIVVLVLFVALALLWLFRADLSFSDTATLPGWSTRMYGEKKAMVQDGTTALALTILLFLIRVPSDLGSDKGVSNEDLDLVDHNNEEEDHASNEEEGSSKWVPILDWEYTEKRIPWSIMFLFAGGFALNQGFSDSGLDSWIGEQLNGLTKMPLFVLILVISIIGSILANMGSNTACANIILPIVAVMAQKARNHHPWVLLIPCALATSCSYILPVGTPPNLICYGSGKLAMKDFLIAGSFVNVVALFIVTGLGMLLVPPVFQAYGFPEWAEPVLTD